MAAACANPGDPPGGPPDVAPPRIVSVRPESGAVVPGWKDDAVLQFDEVIDEQPGTSGAALTGLARLVVLSPVAGDVKVEWGRTRIRVKPKEGWKPGRVYRLELRPGVLDLRRNRLDSGRVVLFSTGPEPGRAALRGTALQWFEQRALPAALIEAVPLPDTVGYVTLADSGGRFRLDGLRPGSYLVYATADQNNNRRRDRREAYDSAALALDSSATVALFTFVHDTVGPRLRAATPVDSLTARIEFVQPLDGAARLDSTQVRVVQLPDSTPVPLAAVLTQKQHDSLTAAARAAKPDTAAAPAAPKAPAARVDTTEVRRLLAQRPVPVDRIVLRFTRALAPETRYLIRVRGATSLSGVAGDAQGVLTTPKAPAP
ncbi:MAG: Ig-like domain-containing protein, partial [Gemmatimonadales bacterium]